MDPNTNLTTLLPFAAFSGIVGYLVSLFKPFIEKIPGIQPGRDLHDPALRLISIGLNIVAAVAYGFYSNALPSALWPNFVIAGLLQAAGSEAYYKTVTRFGASIGDSGVTSLPKSILTLFAPPGDAVTPQSGVPPVPSAISGANGTIEAPANVPIEVLRGDDSAIVSHIPVTITSASPPSA